MAPSSPRSPSTDSVLSCPSTDLSVVELQTPTVSMNRSKRPRSSSAESEQLGCRKKARKRKSSAVEKPAVKELVAADMLTFRNMVHEFTGMKAVASRPETSWASTASEALLAEAVVQSLRAVKTITALLLQRASAKDLLIVQDEMEKASFLAALKQRKGGDEYTSEDDKKGPESLSGNSSLIL